MSFITSKFKPLYDTQHHTMTYGAPPVQGQAASLTLDSYSETPTSPHKLLRRSWLLYSPYELFITTVFWLCTYVNFSLLQQCVKGKCYVQPLRHHTNAFLSYVIINHHWFGSDFWFVSSYRPEMPLQREEVKVSESCSNRMLRLKHIYHYSDNFCWRNWVI